METRYRDFVHDWFSWVSGLCDDQELATLGEVHRFWAENARIVTHGEIRADGIQALEKMFGLFPSQFEQVKIHAPYYTYIEAGDEVVIEFDNHVRPCDPEGGDGQQLRVIMILSMADGKIAQMREVSAVKAGEV